MHRNEADRRVMLDERLRSVPVMNVPVYDQYALGVETRASVEGGDCYVAEEAEPHCPIAQGVMTGRAYSAEAARRLAAQREIHGVEHRAGAGSRGIPRSLADDGVGVEAPTAGERHLPNGVDVASLVSQRELVLCRVPSLDVTHEREEFRIVPQRTRDRAQPTDVLRMAPPRVVPAAVGVRDEGDAQRTGRRLR